MFGDELDPEGQLGAGRDALLARLRADGSLTEDAVEAIALVPRERFVPARHAEVAYEDAALEIGPAATISAPSMVAAMLAVMDVAPGQRVLEIGAGSGYAAATVAALGARVVAVEIQAELVEQARANLDAAGFADRVEVVLGDGRLGWPDGAPYDRILVSAAVPALPSAWLDQLAPDGLLVYPEAGDEEDILVRLSNGPEGLRREEAGRCRFVRLQLDG
ncbi:MAG: protein-L-isoaspartate(D-aspartate) O-methyltransferase [Chloroflexota bacterium]|jgi:protein-L-isoaspartate(D-aspartate) O-methyltransferase|nr:protein-L-isoaspartate(D-aspartate) O-methyltransferase [Chloroflexota bacterium]